MGAGANPIDGHAHLTKRCIEEYMDNMGIVFIIFRSKSEINIFDTILYLAEISCTNLLVDGEHDGDVNFHRNALKS